MFNKSEILPLRSPLSLFLSSLPLLRLLLSPQPAVPPGSGTGLIYKPEGEEGGGEGRRGEERGGARHETPRTELLQSSKI